MAMSKIRDVTTNLPQWLPVVVGTGNPDYTGHTKICGYSICRILPKTN